MPDDRLRCQVPGCKAVIRGMTGLQELMNFRKHMKRAHLMDMDMNQALEWRVKYEDQQAAKEGAR